MEYYLFLIPLISAFAVFSPFRVRGYLVNATFSVVLIVTASIIIASRGQFSGSDTFAYVSAFKEISGMTSFSFSDISFIYRSNRVPFVEPFFGTLTYLISLVTDDIYVYLFTLSFLGFSLLLIAYRKLSDNYLLVFILFLMSFTYVFLFANAIRQAIAVPLVINGIISLYLCDNRPKLKFFLCIFCASLFHLASIVYIVLLFLKNKSNVTLIFGAIFILVISQFGVVSSVLSLIPIELVRDKVVYYFSQRAPIGLNLISGIFFSVLG